MEIQRRNCLLCCMFLIEICKLLILIKVVGDTIVFYSVALI